eukprot:SAG31_NODE_570_length_14016_cov_10.573543_5_plen_42_part_00
MYSVRSTRTFNHFLDLGWTYPEVVLLNLVSTAVDVPTNSSY